MLKMPETMSNSIVSCGSRLPCGLCMVTQQPCPYYWPKQEITCNGTGTGDIYPETIITSMLGGDIT